MMKSLLRVRASVVNERQLRQNKKIAEFRDFPKSGYVHASAIVTVFSLMVSFQIAFCIESDS